MSSVSHTTRGNASRARRGGDDTIASAGVGKTTLVERLAEPRSALAERPIQHTAAAEGARGAEAPTSAGPAGAAAGTAARRPGLDALFGQHLRASAQAGVGAADQPFPHLDALRAVFGPERHQVIARTPAAVGGAARSAAERMGHAMHGEVRGWALDHKVAFPAAPSLSEAAHEGAHVLGADESQAQQVAELASRGARADHVLPAMGDRRSGAHAAPQFIVLQSGERDSLRTQWINRGLSAPTVDAILEQNANEPDKWRELADLESRLGQLYTRQSELLRCLFETGPLKGRKLALRELIGNDGKNNFGVFLADDLEDERKYVVKVVKSGAISQFKDLEALDGKPIANPKKPDPNHPRFAKCVGYVSESDIQDGTFKGDRPALGVLEAASGEQLSKIHDRLIGVPEKLSTLIEIYAAVGRAIGALNTADPSKDFVSDSQPARWETWTHNDLNPSNVFYDVESGNVTLIDNDGVSRHAGIHAISRDTGDLFLPAGAIAREAGRERKNSDSVELLPKEKELNTQFLLFAAFVKGHLSKAVKITNLVGHLIPKFRETVAGYLKTYEASAGVQNEERLKIRFPAYYELLERLTT